MSEVWIVQHAEKEAGRGDPGLTSLGFEQARSTAQYLQDQRFGGVFTSPLRRARQTAQIIADMCGYELKTDGRLAERLNWVDADQTFDEFLAEWEISSRDRDLAPDGGTSSRAAGEQFLRACADAVQLAGGEDVVVVSHGGVTTETLRNLLSDDALSKRSAGILTEGVPNCAITVLRLVGDEWEVVRVAERNHLE